MKKTLAIVLAVLMVSALAVTASAASLPIVPKAEAGVTTVRVTKAAVGEAAAEEVYLGVQPVLDADGKMTKDETTDEYIYNTEAAEINSLACATGTITFDKATGTLTLDGVTGIQSIFSPDVGNLTVNVKGTNTIETSEITTNLKSNKGNLIITGDGTLNIVSATAKAYPIVSQIGGVEISGSVKLNVNVDTANCAIHSGRTTESFIHILDNAQVTVKNVDGRGIYAAGHSTEIVITDNAIVDVEAKGDAIYVLVDRIDTTTANFDNTGLLEVSGKAQVKLVGGSCGIRTNFNVTGDNGEAGDLNVIFKDEAKVDVTAPGQVVYLAAGTTKKATLEIAGSADVNVTNTGKYAGLDLRGKEANTFKMTGGSLEVTLTNAENTLGALNSGNAAITIDIAKDLRVKQGASKDAAASIDAGTLAVDKNVKYLAITSDATPPTSDNAVASIALVALVSLAAAAMIVLRRRVHD